MELIEDALQGVGCVVLRRESRSDRAASNEQPIGRHQAGGNIRNAPNQQASESARVSAEGSVADAESGRRSRGREYLFIQQKDG